MSGNNNHNLPPDAFQTFTYTPGQPIPAALFAEALKDLPLDALYAKAAELQNSISHLLASNIEMKPFADSGDEVCTEAIKENDAVLARMEERIVLCRREVEGRGLRWSGHAGDEGKEEEDEDRLTNGEGGVNVTNGERHGGDGVTVAARDSNRRNMASGRLTDDELRRQLEAQLEEETESEGVHL